MHIKQIQLLHLYWHQGYQSETEVLHISCNIGTRDLPICMPSALGLLAYILGKSLMPMLEL